MPIAVLISMTGHIVVTGIYNYLLSLPILYLPSKEAFKHPSWLWFFTWWGDPTFIPKGFGPLVVLPELSCSFTLTLIRGMAILRDTPRQGCQTHFHRGPHQPRGCLQRAEYNFWTV